MDMNLVLDISGNDLKDAIIQFNNQMEIGNFFVIKNLELKSNSS